MNDTQFFPKQHLQELIDCLRASGHRVVGPVERDGTVLVDEVRRVADLPVGRRDRQEPGVWRMEPGVAGEVFGVVHGPSSLKEFLFAAREPLLEIHRDGEGLAVAELVPADEPIAVLGVRACDLAGAGRQDRIFLHDRVRDTHYEARRSRVFVVAVQCTRSVSTCFCSSMGTGPALGGGYDVALTELEHGFVARSGSEAGAALLASMACTPVAPADLAAADEAVDRCEAGIQRRFDVSGLRELLPARSDHPRWDDVAQRCLSCGNCTLVCPTCFCHTVTDATDILGSSTQRIREWESCFSPDHGKIHGKNFRPTTRERYRQWLTHKLATWIDQFGESGCVGCGRCIAWCPVGIDLTREVAGLRDTAEVVE
jgi:ferredoxin